MVTCLDLGCLYIVWVMLAVSDHESLLHIKIMVGTLYIINVYEKGHGLRVCSYILSCCSGGWGHPIAHNGSHRGGGGSLSSSHITVTGVGGDFPNQILPILVVYFYSHVVGEFSHLSLEHPHAT